MKRTHDQFYRPQKSEHLADVLYAKFNNRFQTLQRYQVFESGNGIYHVELPYIMLRTLLVSLIGNTRQMRIRKRKNTLSYL
jgi:hypothetical protein